MSFFFYLKRGGGAWGGISRRQVFHTQTCSRISISVSINRTNGSTRAEVMLQREQIKHILWSIFIYKRITRMPVLLDLQWTKGLAASNLYKPRGRQRPERKTWHLRHEYVALSMFKMFLLLLKWNKFFHPWHFQNSKRLFLLMVVFFLSIQSIIEIWILDHLPVNNEENRCFETQKLYRGSKIIIDLTNGICYRAVHRIP